MPLTAVVYYDDHSQKNILDLPHIFLTVSILSEKTLLIEKFTFSVYSWNEAKHCVVIQNEVGGECGVYEPNSNLGGVAGRQLALENY